MNKLVSVFLLLMVCQNYPLMAQQGRFNDPGMGNPILPGYFADPTVKKFDDRYFIYATTDGTGWGTGPSQVWYSKDFVNWTKTEMNWPTTEVYWAPDVWQDENGKYYMYYSQPVQLHGGVSDTPYGPWKELTEDGSPIVPDRFVHNVITLDGQSFLDDDGARYLYWGTWGIYEGFGAGWARFNENIMSFSEKGIIPNTQATDFFEGPFVFKRNGVYYFTYSSGSCHDGTYRVQYATGDSPTGPFTFRDNNPILSTTSDGTIHGPGHHSILNEGDDYFIVYHKHDNPHSSNGFHRQVAVDKLEFDAEGRIKKVVPTHEGIGYLAKDTNPFDNLLYQKECMASSEYSHEFKAAYATDDNHGTLWMPDSHAPEPSITVDMGSVQRIQRTRTAFQYATHYFQYLIEHSVDGKSWEVFSDKRENVLSGSPMTDYNDVQARYLKLTITGVGKQGFPLAVWDFSAFKGYQQDPEQLLIDLEAVVYAGGSVWSNHQGMYGGALKLAEPAISDKQDGEVYVRLRQPASGLRAPLQTNASMDYTAIVTMLKGPEKVYVALQWDAFKKAFASKMESNTTFSKAEINSLRTALMSLLQDGKLTFDTPLVSVKVFNRALGTSEVAHYGMLSYQAPAQVSEKAKGLLVAVSVDELDVGDQVATLSNPGVAAGTFKAIDKAPRVGFIAGRKALIFDNGETLISDFKTPLSLTGDHPYTVETWVLNPEIAVNECILDWAPRGGQLLTSTQIQYGSNPSWGAVAHQEWADMGFDGGIPEANRWHHMVVTFDGYMEKVYVDGQLNASEQKMLFVKGGGNLYIGNTSDGQVPFTGAVAALKVYDQAMNEAAIQLAYQAGNSSKETLVYLTPADLGFGAFTEWKNQGVNGGAFKLVNGKANVGVVANRLAISLKGTLQLQPISAYSLTEYHVLITACEKDDWHRYALSASTGKSVIYRDGAPYEGKKFFEAFGLSGLENLQKLTVEGKHVFSTLIVEKGSLSEQELAKNSKKPMTTNMEEVGFASAPRALTSVSAQMEAIDFPDQSVHYLFVRMGDQPGNSGWQRSVEYLDHTLNAGSVCDYYYLVQGQDGTIVAKSSVVRVTTDQRTYTETLLHFDTPVDLLTTDERAGFDGIINGDQSGVTGLRVMNGALRLASQGSGFYEGKKLGAFVWKELVGDFVAEVEVKDYSGMAIQKGVAYNEGGLLVTLPKSMKQENWDLVSLGFFPLYNQGNMLTNQHQDSRLQQSNMRGWEAHRFLQIQRRGSMILLRTSADGSVWKEMPGSPIERPDLLNQKVYIGLYHVTHSDNEGYITFDNFRLSELK